ncbi:hypothetical protein N0V83_002465 [Neocucurbitaria cava]|uniref:Bacteriophage T5 Orf172 DNA-binding domain-containing protein n=1 Tax=Neocucurbitaria cava TaxID=798079 RepID=A0A9W8YEV9_9PLEO|nr:hypothetical protein N0V83_002465 [Neocucurbitaria cava]
MFHNKGDYTELLAQIERLVQVVMCGSHRNSALLTPKDNPRMTKLKSTVSRLPSISNEDHKTLKTWLLTISNPELRPSAALPKDHELLVKTEPTTRKCRSSNTPKSPTSTSASPKVTTINEPSEYATAFSPYQPKKYSNLSVFEALHSVITTPLKSTDEKNGFIYMFWDKKYFGMVKIGRTVDLQARLDQWNTQCKRTHSYLTVATNGEQDEIPHVSRIERLIHLELKEYRRQRRCEGCGKNHVEWFHVGETHAVKVFQKWREWIIQKPYALDPHTGEWTIRADMMHTLTQVCEPVPVEQMQPTPGRRDKRKPVRRSAPFNR